MDYQISPLPLLKENAHLLRQEQSARNAKFTDIFNFYSKDALIGLKVACELAKSLGHFSVTHWHLFYVLANKEIPGLQIDKKDLEVIGKKVWDRLSTLKSEFKYGGVVFFSPELKKVLLAAYFISHQRSMADVNNIHLMAALAKHPETQETFGAIDMAVFEDTGFYLPKPMAEYVTDLTAHPLELPDSKLSRKQELENALRILSRQSRHNIILLGDDGVGKSTMGRLLAGFLKGHKTAVFAGSRVLALDIGTLFSMTGSDARVISNITDSVSSMGQIIFILENAGLLTSSLQISQLVDFLQLLDKRGQVLFMLPATPVFYKEYLAVNPYISSSFEAIKIEELSGDSTIEIIGLEMGRIEKLYKVSIEKPALTEVVNLSKRYLEGKLPQKAITLLEEVAAGATLMGRASVTVSEVRDVVSQKTGIPLSSLTSSEAETLINLEVNIGKYVVGQDEAIKKVSEALRRARAGLKDNKKPIGSFLFLGPTGVGKTELAKTLAKLFFNDENSFFRFDMSEYAESHTAQRLIGSPPGYVGYGEGGQLTNRVKEKPYCLILFDEIEKAHVRVFDLFLQILDDGRLTDSQGTVVDFRNTMIIFTSNIASNQIFENRESLVSPSFDRKQFFDKSIMPIVRQYFRPELVNRFDDIVMFNPLTKMDLIKIAHIKIEQLKAKLSDKHISFEITEAKLSELVEASYDPGNGARPLEREIKERIENYLAGRIISGEVKEGEVVKWE